MKQEDYNSRVPEAPDPLDTLAAELLARHDYRFAVATDDVAREAAYRLRHSATVDHGWAEPLSSPEGIERDPYDDHAVLVVGWDGDIPFATGRLVLPPGPLPTEEICGITVQPVGRVVDVGRMTIARTHQAPGHAAFVALLASLFLEVRRRRYDVACGLMSARARALVRLLGVRLELLGAERPYWGEPRAPVRFSVEDNVETLLARWR